jgi:nucleoside-diphosphate-sugar epimerase
MKVFLTGATGYIGSAVAAELIQAGHQVLGLARSGAGTQSLTTAGVAVHRGSLEDPETLRLGAQQSDAVIHCAYDHDFSRLKESTAKERQAIEALGAGLTGTDRPLLITSVCAMGASAPGQLAVEDHNNPDPSSPRRDTEIAAAAVAGRGTNVVVVRLPQVHSTVRLGFVSQLIRVAREKGVSAYVGEGLNRWAAAHLRDVAHLYRLALEKHAPGSRYHAVAEEGISLRQIAQTLGTVLGLPVVSLSTEEAAAHFGWLAMFAGRDMSAASRLTRERLAWHPTGPKLISDLEQSLSTSGAPATR